MNDSVEGESHSLALSVIFERLKTISDGHTDEEVNARQKRFGRNELPSPSRRSALARFLSQFHNVHIYDTSLTASAIRGTSVIWACIAIIVAAQFTITYAPGFQAVFDTRDVSLMDGLLIVGVGVALFAIIEVEKQFRLRTVSPGSRE